MSAYDIAGWACIALGLTVYAVWLVRRFRQAGRDLDAALPGLLDGPPCAVLTCNQAGTVTIHGWTVCTDHDPRTPYDRARDGLDDVLDGRAK